MSFISHYLPNYNITKMKRSGSPVAPPTVKRPMRRQAARRPRKLPMAPTVSIARTQITGAWSVGTATVGDFWRTYSPTVAGSFNNFSEFAAVFDQYKVNAIKIKFYPRYNSIDANPTTLTNTTVKMVTVVDPYSTLVPAGVYSATTANVLMEQSGARVRDGLKPVTVYWRPKIAIPTNVGGGVTYVDSSKMWLNTTSTAVPFLGFQALVATNNFSTPIGLVYDVFVTYYATFRNLK